MDAKVTCVYNAALKLVVSTMPSFYAGLSRSLVQTSCLVSGQLAVDCVFFCQTYCTHGHTSETGYDIIYF